MITVTLAWILMATSSLYLVTRTVEIVYFIWSDIQPLGSDLAEDLCRIMAKRDEQNSAKKEKK